jgi:lipid A 3-O-deacylase
MKLVTGWKVIAAVTLAAAIVVGSTGTARAQGFSSSSAGDESVATAAAPGAAGQSSATSASFTPFGPGSAMPFEFGASFQGGVGLTENRDGFKFLMAGVHAGKVLYRHDKPGFFTGNFEYGMELFPYWQSFTPKFQRANCVAVAGGSEISCTPLYTVGGTFSGASFTPIILRWNFAGRRRIAPYVQGAGGLLWTNHKYPAFGSPTLNLINDGPNTDASVWNFTPQGGVGLHYFLSPRRSIDFGANAVHISSASLGDKNPGVNASVQFSLGYSFWK